MASAASDEILAATDVADLLVRLGTPFREAHGVVAGLVRAALDSGKTLSELDDAELAQHNGVLAANSAQFREVLKQGSWLESKVSAGGTSSARLGEQIAAARALLDGSARS
jgi:argininosuccinate lyase